jgi:hypothetical protein
MKDSVDLFDQSVSNSSEKEENRRYRTKCTYEQHLRYEEADPSFKAKKKKKLGGWKNKWKF